MPRITKKPSGSAEVPRTTTSAARPQAESAPRSRARARPSAPVDAIDRLRGVSRDELVRKLRDLRAGVPGERLVIAARIPHRTMRSTLSEQEREKQ